MLLSWFENIQTLVLAFIFLLIFQPQAQGRLEDQRSRAPGPMDDEDFFSLLLRVQGGRMDEQRTELPGLLQTWDRKNCRAVVQPHSVVAFFVWFLLKQVFFLDPDDATSAPWNCWSVLKLLRK